MIRFPGDVFATVPWTEILVLRDAPSALLRMRISTGAAYILLAPHTTDLVLRLREAASKDAIEGFEAQLIEFAASRVIA